MFGFIAKVRKAGIYRHLTYILEHIDDSFAIPKRLEVKAASEKGIIFLKFSVWNSGASSGYVRKLRVQRARRGYDICIERETGLKVSVITTNKRNMLH